MQRLKIGFLLLLNHTGKGGVENVLKTVTSGLKEYNVESFIYSLHKPEDTSFIEFFDNFSYEEPSFFSLHRPKFLPKFIYKLLIKNELNNNLKTILKKASSDNLDALLVLNLSKQFDRYFDQLKQFKEESKTPLISWVHGTLSDTPQKIIRRLKKKIYLFDAHFAISNGIAQEIQSYYKQSNIYIVHNPIEHARLICRDKNRFIYMGRIDDDKTEDNKRVYSLIKQLRNLNGNWHLDIIGSTGNNINDFRFLEKIRALGLRHHISFHGWKEQPWKEIDRGGVLLLNSKKEGFGLVIAEAMMRGIPVVSSNCPVGPKDIIIPGINGWLYDVNKEEAIALILQKIIDTKLHLPSPIQIQKSVSHFRKEHVIYYLHSSIMKIIKQSSN